MRSRKQIIAIILSKWRKKTGSRFAADSLNDWSREHAAKLRDSNVPQQPSEPSAAFQAATKGKTEADWDHFSKELRTQAEAATLEVLARMTNKRYFPAAIITGDGESDSGLAVTVFDNASHRGVVVLHETRWNDPSADGAIIGSRLSQHEHWSVGDSIKDVIAHEIGHAVHWRLAQMNPALFKKIMKEQFGKDHQRVSDYAKENEFEAFAETFSAIFTDVKPLKPHIIAAAKKLEDTLIAYKVLSPRTGTKTEAMKKAPLKLTPGMKKKLAVHRAAMANAQELADMTGDEE